MTKIITSPCINSMMLDGIPDNCPMTLPPTLNAPNNIAAKITPIGLALAKIAIPIPAGPISGLKFHTSICCTPLTSVKPAIAANAPLIINAITYSFFALIPDKRAASAF